MGIGADQASGADLEELRQEEIGSSVADHCDLTGIHLEAR
jgi:hypothetical protein